MESKTGTVTIHRVLTTPPKRLYEAFLNASALAKWLPPYGFTCQVHEYLPEVGGQFKMSFTNFSKGGEIKLIEQVGHFGTEGQSAGAAGDSRRVDA